MKKHLLVLMFVSALVASSSSLAVEKKSTKRKPSSMAVTSRATLAAHTLLDVGDIPIKANRFCAMVTTTPGFGTSTVSYLYSPEGKNGKGTCVSYDLTNSYDGSQEKNKKLSFATWESCYANFRDAVAKEAGDDGDVVEGSLRNAEEYKGVMGEFTQKGASSKFDCGDLGKGSAK